MMQFSSDLDKRDQIDKVLMTRSDEQGKLLTKADVIKWVKFLSDR